MYWYVKFILHGYVTITRLAWGAIIPIPNARGIPSGDPRKQIEDVCEEWMSVRWVIPANDMEPE